VSFPPRATRQTRADPSSTRRIAETQQHRRAGEQALKAHSLGIWKFKPRHLQENELPSQHPHGPAFGHYEPSAKRVTALTKVMRKEGILE